MSRCETNLSVQSIYLTLRKLMPKSKTNKGKLMLDRQRYYWEDIRTVNQ